MNWNLSFVIFERKLFLPSPSASERKVYYLPMFTGIIEVKGIVESVDGGQLILARPSSFTDISMGSSIAVGGVCLTIVEFDEQSMTFDVVGETREKSTLGALQKGDIVNLERAMKAEDRFEGHIVQGHTEGVGEIISVEQDGPWTNLIINLSDDVVPTVVQKGSITIDGVSLTVASVTGNECRIALIPQTIEHTTLGELKKGDHVNIETDVLGRYVHSLATQK
tara:strand:- start:322 stop:990 length:669 start_codon:yes stop_codon:yes gene_type:complete